ncbi:pyrroloquinoline quinone precursor peptide PqqA [Roseomonas sp. KE0001]|uniref:pyrroloquinoline quinone precursor peptide PqqA n=1 Tax=Roseomonas sp. KE0001 TaxID=2479201 RepID=UPI0018DEFB33|nr:pyrroloquinoline quinone precursor peptide PqqA [Roseomonas sp. KE0001]
MFHHPHGNSRFWGRVERDARPWGALTPARAQPLRSSRMKIWKKPRIVEIHTGMEINSYAVAE